MGNTRRGTTAGPTEEHAPPPLPLNTDSKKSRQQTKGTALSSLSARPLPCRPPHSLSSALRKPSTADSLTPPRSSPDRLEEAELVEPLGVSCPEPLLGSTRGGGLGSGGVECRGDGGAGAGQKRLRCVKTKPPEPQPCGGRTGGRAGGGEDAAREAGGRMGGTEEERGALGDGPREGWGAACGSGRCRGSGTWPVRLVATASRPLCASRRLSPLPFASFFVASLFSSLRKRRHDSRLRARSAAPPDADDGTDACTDGSRCSGGGGGASAFAQQLGGSGGGGSRCCCFGGRCSGALSERCCCGGRCGRGGNDRFTGGATVGCCSACASRFTGSLRVARALPSRMNASPAWLASLLSG